MLQLMFNPQTSYILIDYDPISPWEYTSTLSSKILYKRHNLYGNIGLALLLNHINTCFQVGAKWIKNNLTYRVVKYPTKSLSASVVDQEVALAFQIWEEAADLKFIRDQHSNNKVDIKLRCVLQI